MKTVKQNITWFWQNLEKVLIIIFFFTFTLNIRKVFLTSYSFLKGGFIEYTTISFGWTDALMLSIILIYTIKLLISQYSELKNRYTKSENNNIELSSYTSSYVSRETFFLLFFLLWCGVSIFWSEFRPLAAYRFAVLVEMAIFAFIVVMLFKNENKWFKMALLSIIMAGLFQSAVGIIQFVINGSLGLHALGESIIGPDIAGAAKIAINGEKHIRAYGTFPHPNIMAGFLIIPLFILIREFSTSPQPSPSREERADLFLLNKEKAGMEPRNVSHETFLNFIPRRFFLPVFAVTMIGFILTFSRSAFLGFFIGLLTFITLVAYLQSLPRFYKGMYKLFVALTILLIFATFILLKYTTLFSNQSMAERKLFQIVSYETISQHPLIGIGLGQFVINEYLRYPNLQNWQYQPVHNIYLLVASELGVIGLSILLLVLFTFILPVGNNGIPELNLTIVSLYCIIISFFAISFFDHYFWDLKIGVIIFSLPFLLLASEKQ